VTEPLTAARAEETGRSSYMLLTTYRREGTAVPTPLWCVVEDGVLYGSTQVETGKVKRIRRDGTSLVAPCNARGTAGGPAYAAHAEVLEGEAGPPRPRAGREAVPPGQAAVPGLPAGPAPLAGAALAVRPPLPASD
jgi:hypothetical protein